MTPSPEIAAMAERLRSLNARQQRAYHLIADKGKNLPLSALPFEEWAALADVMEADGFIFDARTLPSGGEVRHRDGHVSRYATGGQPGVAHLSQNDEHF